MSKQEQILEPRPDMRKEVEGRLPPSRLWPVALGFAAFVLVPTIIAAIYWWGVAADRYVVEIRYSVRGGATMPSADGGGVLDGAGALVFAGDSFILEDFVRSSAMVEALETRLPLRDILGRDGDDPVRRYDRGASIETLLDFWTAAVDPYFDATTGITTVTISLFEPEDALAVGRALVTEARALIDGLSAEARRRMLRYVEGEFERAASDLDAARAAIAQFRSVNQIISPEDEADVGSSIIAELSQTLTTRRVELRTLRDRTPGSPRIGVLEDEIDALEAQILSELNQRGDGAGLPERLKSFEELQSDFEIARDTFVNTLRLRQQAEAYATLGEAELVVFVPPRAPTEPTRPLRWLETLKVFGVALAVWMMGRIFFSSIRV